MAPVDCWGSNTSVTTPRTGMEVCPQCYASVKNPSGRLVQDACGHKKCRLCLLQEEDGCVTCAKAAKAGDIIDLSSISVSEFEDHGYDNETIFQKSVEVSSPLSENQSQKCAEPDCVNVNTTIHSASPVHSAPDNEKSDEKCVKSNANEEQDKEKEEEAEKPRKRKSIVIESHITVLPGSPTQYQCTACNKTFSSRYSVRYHNFCASKKKPFTCDDCNKGFVTKSHFEYHLRIHSGDLPYVCSDCGKGFKQKGKLTRHLRSHSGERPFICNDCGKAFVNADGLKSHERTHTGEKPYICKTCSRGFSECSNYKKHVLIHTGEKLFICEECGKDFRLKQRLQMHLLIHRRERNHICNVCGRGFAMKQDLKRHHTVHSSERPHSCSLCRISFRRKDNYERHMKNTHPEICMGGNPVQQHVPQPSTSEKISIQQAEREVSQISGVNSILEEAPIPDNTKSQSDTITFRPIIQVGIQESSTEKLIQADPPPEKMSHAESSSKEGNRECINNHYIHVPSSLHCALQSSESHRTNTYDDAQRTIKENTVESNEATKHSHQPKEYYRAVPVINRPANIPNVTEQHTVVKNKDDEAVRHSLSEGKNCVRTITKASDIINANVNNKVSQNVQTIIKHPKLECLRKLEKPASLTTNEYQRANQPILRMLLNDVDCSDKNLLPCTNYEKSSPLFQDSLKYVDNTKFDKVATRGFIDPKLPELYQHDFLTQNYEVSKASLPNTSDYYDKRLPFPEDLIVDNHFRSGYSHSINYNDIIESSYMLDDLGNDRIPSTRTTETLLNSSDTSVNSPKHYTKFSNFNYSPYMRSEEELSGKLKLLADAAGSKDPSLHESQVIVGTRSITNNVICSNSNV